MLELAPPEHPVLTITTKKGPAIVPYLIKRGIDGQMHEQTGLQNIQLFV